MDKFQKQKNFPKMNKKKKKFKNQAKMKKMKMKIKRNLEKQDI